MAEDRHDDSAEDAPAGEERGRTGIRRRLGRLLNQRELAEDTREVFTGVLEMSDRAKTEAVRLVAREARNYLDELKIKEDLLDLMTSHSLEVKLSVHLKPLADSAREVAKAAKASKTAEVSDTPPAQSEASNRKRAKAKAPATVPEAATDPEGTAPPDDTDEAETIESTED